MGKVVLVLLVIVLVGGGFFGYRYSQTNVELEELKSYSARQTVQIAELETTIGHLERQLNEVKAEVEELRNSLTEKNVRIGEREATIASLEGQLKEVKAEVEELRNSLAEKSFQIAEKETTVGHLEGQLKEVKAEVRELRSSLIEKNIQIAERKTTIGHLERQLNEVKDEVEELRNSLTEKNVRIGEREATIANLDKQLESLSDRTNEMAKEKTLLEDLLLALSQTKKTNSNKVLPILFVPADMADNLLYLEKINRTMSVVQAWYALRVGRTFDFSPTKLIRGRHNLSWYQDVWGKVYEDLGNQGLPASPNERRIVFLQGGGGFAGGAASQNGDWGFAVLGDIALSGISGQPAGTVSWMGKEPQMGAVAHELGHAFGLPDAPKGTDNSVMRNWPAFPEVGFTDSEIQLLLKNPFLQ